MEDTRPEGATNERARGESIAGTAPGIPDEALGPGEQLSEPPADEEVARAARAIGAPVPDAAQPGQRGED